jgi:hypothetical protein
MTSFVLDIAQLVSSVIDNSSNINTRLIETINNLEEIFNYSHPQAPEIFHQRFKEIRKQSEQLKLELHQKQDLSQQFKSSKSFRESLKNFRIQFQDFLPLNFLKAFEEAEYTLSSLEVNTAIYSNVFEITKVIGNINVESHEEIKLISLESIYNSLTYLLETVEMYKGNIPENLLKNIKETAEISLLHLDKYQLEDEKQKEYLRNSKAQAKAILWDISNSDKKSEKRFKTVDELFEYWNEKYDEEEVEKSLEALMKGIDEERRRQGGRTLFSESR